MTNKTVGFREAYFLHGPRGLQSMNCTEHCLWGEGAGVRWLLFISECERARQLRAASYNGWVVRWQLGRARRVCHSVALFSEKKVTVICILPMHLFLFSCPLLCFPPILV